MKRFIYIITEGVHDVLVISQVLQRGFGLIVIENEAGLPEEAKKWLKMFPWPLRGDITRRSVPTPEFLENDTLFVGISNSRGIGEIRKRLNADFEAFSREENWFPGALGIILDADEEAPEKRFLEFADLVAQAGFPRPEVLDSVAELGKRCGGVFSFPGGGQPGTLEDVLIPIAGTRFPDLHTHATSFVQTWQQQDSAALSGDYKELRKPKGGLKATLSAMVSLLKPGKGLPPSIQDQKWIPDDVSSCVVLKPLMDFLTALLLENRAKN
jgi:hypothetical protein